jgi:hypothetical protein
MPLLGSSTSIAQEIAQSVSKKDADIVHSLPTTVDVPYGLDIIIRSRQQNVVNRQYHSPAWRNQPHLMPVGNELAQVTTLQLYLQSLDDC